MTCAGITQISSYKIYNIKDIKDITYVREKPNSQDQRLMRLSLQVDSEFSYLGVGLASGPHSGQLFSLAPHSGGYLSKGRGGRKG
jgi:hypothetical protein